MRALVLVSSLFVAAVALGGKPKSERREPRRYALREIKFEGGVSETEQRLLEERIWSAIEIVISARGDELIHAEDVQAALAQKPMLKGCYETRCQLALGEAIKAERVVTVEIRHQGPEGVKGDWLAKISEFAVDGMTVVGSAEVPCKDCSADNLIGDVTHSVDPLFKVQPLIELCSLSVTSTPPGATAIIDGSAAGETPFSHTITSGKHAIAAEKDGFVRGESQVECPAMGIQTAELTLVARKAVVQERRPTPALKIVGGVLIAVGVGAIVAGGVSLAFDGRGTCDLTGGQTQCPQVYDSAVMGGALVGVGAAALVGGVVTIVVDHMRGRKKSLALDVAPLPSGAQVLLQGGW